MRESGGGCSSRRASSEAHTGQSSFRARPLPFRVSERVAIISAVLSVGVSISDPCEPTANLGLWRRARGRRSTDLDGDGSSSDAGSWRVANKTIRFRLGPTPNTVSEDVQAAPSKSRRGLDDLHYVTPSIPQVGIAPH